MTQKPDNAQGSPAMMTNEQMAAAVGEYTKVGAIINVDGRIVARMTTLLIQLWGEREKNRAVMVQTRDALARAREYAVGDAFIQIEQSLAALNDALGGE